MNSLLKRLVFLFILPFLMLSTTALGQDNRLVIGQAIDLSGPNGSLGRDYVAGITTYFDSLNASGGINGRKIRFIAKDDQGNPELSSRLVSELLEKDKADYLLGGIGAAVTDAVTSNPKFAQSGITLFAPLIGSVKNYGSRVLFWRPSPEQEMQYIFSYFDKLGIKNVGVALQESSLNQDMFQYVASEIKKRNMTLSGVVHVNAAGNVMSSEAAKLAAANPNIVIAVADTIATGIFLKEFRKTAPRTFVAGMSLTNLETLAEVAGAHSLEWTVFSQVVPNPLGKKSSIQLEHSNMMKKYRDEDMSSLTFEGFVVAKTLVRAIQMSKGGKDGLQLLAAQKNSIDMGGITLTPNENSWRISSYVDIAMFRKGGGLVF